jgi:tetraacyldisaccharide 4'-kinase
MNPEFLYRRLAPFLRPLAAPYAHIMERRRQAYALGRKEAYRPHVPCISVGNITWGGSGKTPLTGALLAWAAERNLRVVVLSRGYGGKPGDRPLLVAPDTPPERCGDEPLMLARAHPQARVVVFPHRAEAARFAENNLTPDLLLLDDGMQHLAVARDLDLVLLRPTDVGEEWGRVIPSGSWREGPKALAAASAFFLKTDAETLDRLRPLIEKRLRPFGVPIFSFDLAPSGLVSLGENVPALDGDYALATGVGDPAGVERTAARLLDRPPAAVFHFPDHHHFSLADVERITTPGLPVVCTAKDAVKLAPFAALASVPFFSLNVCPTWGPTLFSEHTFPRWWEERLHALRPGVFP